MKNKKWLAMLLALLLCLSLCLTACSDRDDEDDDDNDDERVEETADPNDGEWAQNGLFEMGTVRGIIYENEMIGVGCELDGWTYADAERLAEVNHTGETIMSQDAKEMLENSQTFVEMFAEDGRTGNNVNITVQDMQSVFGTIYDVDEMTDLTVEQFRTMGPGMGYENLKVSAGETDFCGASTPCIILSGTVRGSEIHQIIVPIIVDRYLFSLTATSIGTDVCEDILELFYAL